MINVDTELRKLRPAELYNLGLILSLSDNWKKVMASVTKEGNENIPKFPGEYISIVEEAARQERKLAASIFLEEWATMGRKRPTVGLLLEVLMKTELFRAADYLAQDILKVAAPQRPAFGPAAPVDIDAIAEMLQHQNLEADSASKNSDFCERTTDEVRLSQINYPFSVFKSENDDNLADEDNEEGVLKMVCAESRSHQVFEADNELESPNNSNKSESRISKEISDLMKFSSANDSENLIKYSQSDLIKFDSENINSNEGIDRSDAFIPHLSVLRVNSSVNCDSKENANYLEAINVELASSELPACLGLFGNSRETSARVNEIDQRDNQYFNRELVSSEIPLCINSRIGVVSEQASSTIISSESIDDQSSEFIENKSEDCGVSMSNIPCFVVEAGIKNQNAEKTKDVHLEPQKNVLNSMELPLTVLEFQKR